jgi:hypothetical protein
VKRRPAAAALLAVSGLALLALIGLVVGLFYNAKLNDANTQLDEAYGRESAARKEAEAARKAEEAERKKAEQARDLAQKTLIQRDDALERADVLAYFHSLFLAKLALEARTYPEAKRRLAECKAELRGWEWYYLNAQGHDELFAFSPAVWPAFSPDGSKAVTNDRDGTVLVQDVWSGKELLTFKGTRSANAVIPSFSPDGSRIVIVTVEPGEKRLQVTAQAFDARSGKQLFILEGLQIGREFSVKGMSIGEFDRRGSRIAALSEKGVQMYDAGSGTWTLNYIAGWSSVRMDRGSLDSAKVSLP